MSSRTPEKNREYLRAWRAKNPDREKEYQRARKEYFREYMRKRYREKVAAEGRTVRVYRKRGIAKLAVIVPTLAMPGWPTREQLMAGR